MTKQMFKFINAQSTPQDQYVTEIVTLEFATLIGRQDDKPVYGGLRVPYFRKRTKDGGLFWAPSSASVQFYDKKNYVQMRFSDNFFQEDIETFLNERSWDNAVNASGSPSAMPQNIQIKTTQKSEDQGLPF